MSYPFIRAKWYSANAIIEVRALVLHFAEGGGTVSYFTNTTKDVSAHFVLERTGRIVQMVRDEDADHCQHISYGAWSYPGDLSRLHGVAVLGQDVMNSTDPTRVNRYVHAIEIEGFRDTGMNGAQAGSLATWVAERRSKFPTIRGLLGHGDIQDKACPGKLIPWASLGGHGLWEEQMGMHVTLATNPKLGKLAIPKGTKAYRIADRNEYVVPIDATRDAVTAANVGGSGGFLVDLDGDEAHFVYAAGVTFTPAPVTDCADLVAAEHERTRSAAIAAVEALP